MAVDLFVQDDNNFILDVPANDLELQLNQPVMVDPDYEHLKNLPQINHVTLIGDKSFADLGLVEATEESSGLMSAEDKTILDNIDETYATKTELNEVVEDIQDEFDHLSDNYVDWEHVDHSLNSMSENPIDNKTVTHMFDRMGQDIARKQDLLTFDDVPTEGSSNPVTSDGIYDAIETAKGTIPTKTSDLINDGSDGTSTYVDLSELASVATTGDYNDLLNTPENELFECEYNVTTVAQIADAIHAEKLPYLNMQGEYYQFYYGTALNGYQFVCATPNGEIKVVRVDGRGWTDVTTIPLEDTTHKVTSISSHATDVQYPSAKAVYTALQGKQNTLTFDQTPTDNSTNPVTSNGIYEAIEAVSGAMPTKTSDLENDGASGTSTYVEANTLARVATTGEYSDLLNQPTIGTGILTIQKNAANVDTFSANATENKTINITVPTTAADVNALPDSTKYGASIVVSIDSADYKITTTLKDQDGNTLGTAQVIDLPLESVVVNGTYDSVNKKIVLTLENGNTIDIPVGDLVAGLQSEITAQNPLNADLVDDSTSTHKFTTAANLTKLAGIETGAEVNVQADWDQTTDTADDFIKNKPTKTSDFQNDGSDGTAAYLETDETAYRTSAIPWGKVDATSTNKLFTATITGITEYRDGVSFWLKNGVVTSTTGFTVNINGLGGKKCYNNMTAATQDTTIFNVAYTMLFVYDETLDSGNGGFYIYRGYDANTNTIGYQLRTNSTVLKTTDACRYYKIFFTSADGTHWVPASSNTANSATTAKPVNQRPINPFGEIVYCSATTNYAAEADIAATTIWEQYTATLGYSFNRTGVALELTTKCPVYVKCAPQADGSAIMDADVPIVQALPSTDDGKIYIFLGIAYSATAIELVPMHPVYYYKDGAIRQWTNAPNKVSAFTNDAGYLTLATLPIWDGGVI